MTIRILSLAVLTIATVSTRTHAADHSYAPAEEVRSAGLFDLYARPNNYTQPSNRSPSAYSRSRYESRLPVGSSLSQQYRPALSNNSGGGWSGSRCPRGVCPNSQANGDYGAARPLFPNQWQSTGYRGASSQPGSYGTSSQPYSPCANGQCSHGDHRACADGSCGACANGSCNPSRIHNARQPLQRPIPATLAPVGYGLFGRY